ncbi:collagen alpha-1(XII) chain-like [Micropterus salmoides]|uniref:collagen alpha-1(XII) chain-like n=1 Tax=Micropterus salmoides TaxID=27706 RepID=UPI0018EDD3F1|nr:collagen alpha-1(XII) chain-like [Micropterus salmoides]
MTDEKRQAVYLDMDHLLLVLLLLWSSGLQAEGNHTSTGARCETTAKADIVLLVDGSWSIGLKNFAIIRSFVSRTLDEFFIGPDRVQIGLVQYSRNPHTEWHLNTHQTKYSLLKAIRTMPYRGGSTNTGKALNYTLKNNFQPDVGMRADSKKIAVLLTDGQSSDDVRLPSKKLKDAGIEIYAIGVKDAPENELTFIASNPDEIHVYSIEDFSILPDIISSLTINLCSSANSLGEQRVHHK